MRTNCWTILLATIFLLGACNYPPSTNTAEPKGDLLYTSAAQTIAVQLTQLVDPAYTPPTSSANNPTTAATEQLPLVLAPPTETLPFTSTPRPTGTPFPTDTPPPPPPPSATTTPDAQDPKVQLGEPAWRDAFDTFTNWPLFSDEHVEMSGSSGELKIKAMNAGNYEPWMVSWPIVQNFYLEVTASPGECSGLDRYGLLARSAPDASQAYLLGFSCDGRYSLRIWNGRRFSTLVDWTLSPHILAGQGKTNRLGLMAQGSKISLYANGKFLTEVVDGTFVQGAFGLFVNAAQTPGFTATFFEVSYWTLP